MSADGMKVREALVGVFTHFPYTPELMLAAHRLVHSLGIPVDSEAERIADALLAAPLAAERGDGDSNALHWVEVAIERLKNDAVPQAEVLSALTIARAELRTTAPAETGREPTDAMVWAMVNEEDRTIGFERCKAMLRAALRAGTP